jgi:NAD(P)-dependent dehydrogenase (short-subunit alcohol dehydrogenase family)
MPEPDPASGSRFTGRVALVTGAASGIGRATSRRLAAEGAAVFAHDRDGAGLLAVAEQIEAAGGTVVTRTGDLVTRDECVATVAACVDRFDRLDVLANVAGISRADHFTTIDENTYRHMTAVNVDAPFFLCQAAIPHLLEAPGGNIVNLASNSGLMGGAYTAVYCMTKGAVVQLTRALAMEYLKSGLRVNAIAPGATDTALPATFQIPPEVDFDLMARYMVPRPMTDPDEIAGLIALVASDEGRSIHGAILSIDNGVTAG